MKKSLIIGVTLLTGGYLWFGAGTPASSSVYDQVKNKPSKEQGNIKADEIVKKAKSETVTETKYGLTIEIQRIEKIDGGVQVFARAWRGANQLGFGEDGSIEIERFVFINPPLLVESPTGEIISTSTDFKTGKLHTRKLHEDPVAALKQSLAHTISLVGKEGTQITVGKVGNTTYTFYPGAAGDPLSTFYTRGGAGTDFATWRSANITSNSSAADGQSIYIDTNASSNQFVNSGRSIEGFDSSSIPDTDNCTSGTFSYWSSHGAGTELAQSMVIDRAVPATSGTPANADGNLANWAGVQQSDTRIADTDWAAGSYHDFPLNTTGVANISKTGLSWYGTRGSSDFDNSSPTWGSNKTTNMSVYHAAQAGTDNDPKLVAVCASAVVPNNSYTRVQWW